MAIIQMDFDRAIKKASEMENLAGNSMENIFHKVGQAWTGDVSREYLNKSRKAKEKIEGCASRLRKNAGAIRTTARITYEAERTAVLLAQTNEK